MHNVDLIKQKFDALSPLMDERLRRRWAATEARVLGWGGITVVAAATGMSRGTIAAGLRELERSPPEEVPPPRRIRRSGGGRKPTTYQDPTLLRDLERLIDPLTRGDPQSSLRWTCKSTSKLANDLQAKGHRIKERTVARLLKELDYSLQGNRKTR